MKRNKKQIGVPEPAAGADGFYSPQAGMWVYSHDAVELSAPTANNDNKRWNDKCKAQSSPPGKKFCADVVEIKITVKNSVSPKLRIQKLTAAQIVSRIRVVQGPSAGWWDLNAEPVYSPNLESLTVAIKAWTLPQVFKLTVPIEEFRQ